MVALSTGNFTESHFQVPGFVKHLLCHQNYFGVDYPPIFRFTPLAPLLCLTHPLILKFFSTLPLFSIVKSLYTPICKKGFKLCKLGWCSYMISIAKTASKKIVALIHSMKLLSAEVALYLYKYTIWPCMEYCCHVFAGAPSCFQLYHCF